jgi:hypothetical protein
MCDIYEGLDDIVPLPQLIYDDALSVRLPTADTFMNKMEEIDTIVLMLKYYYIDAYNKELANPNYYTLAELKSWYIRMLNELYDWKAVLQKPH